MLNAHFEAYACARDNLSALMVSAVDDGESWERYADLLTGLESLHDPQDLPSLDPEPAGSRADFYGRAKVGLAALREGGFVDGLEVGLLIAGLAAAWDADPAGGDSGASR